MNHFKSYFFLFLIIVLAGLLRILWLDRFPPSLYTDEANQGYNAYSILLTGRDEHGVFLPVSLRSFGDWKPPLPTYLMIPFIAFLGLNEISVRLPSSILGIGIIIVTYFLIQELFAKNKFGNKIALLSCFFLTISPWHILQSRAAMLVIISLFFLEIGLYAFIKGFNKPYFIYFASIAFALSIYAYYGMRVVTPLILFSLLFLYKKEIKRIVKHLIIGIIIGGVILLPLIFAFLKEPNVIFGRARTVSIFYDQGVKLRQWELIAQDGMNYYSILSRFFHNNFYMYGRNIFERLLSHFDGKYLFLEGDKAPPFQIPNMGLFYLLDGLLVILGLFFLYKEKHHHRYLLSLWFLISYIPAILTFMTPTSNRTFNAVVPFMIFSSLGLVYLARSIPHRMILSLAIVALYVLSFGYFLRQYFLVLPVVHADWWNYGWKEVVNYVKFMEKKYKNIIVADTNGMPYIYFLFYGDYDPRKYQENAIRTYVADRFGFEHVEGFDKYFFPNNFEWKYIKDSLQKHTLYVVPASQTLEKENFNKEIRLPNGKTIYKIFVNE